MAGMADYTFRSRDDGEWAVTAIAADGTVVGWASLRSWTEDDGVHVYLADGHVRPADRRFGLGGALLDRAEAAAAELASARGQTGTLVLGGNATEGDDGRHALLTGRGYRRVFTVVWMERDFVPVPRKLLPDEIAVRTATLGDAAALRRLAERAWAGRPFVSLPSEGRLRDWLRRSDLSSFHCAMAGDRLVGFIAVTGDEVEDLQVDPEFQRRGIAAALLALALAGIGGPARLRTEAHDPAGARTLYERFGFRVTEQQHRYRKQLR